MKDEEVITDEEADSWGGHKTKLKALLKMVAHVHDLQGGAERHVEKRKKLSVKQENSDSVFLTFCHHYFVANPGANADKLEEFWKADNPFPRKKVGEWFATFRQIYPKRVKASPSLPAFSSGLVSDSSFLKRIRKCTRRSSQVSKVGTGSRSRMLANSSKAR